MRMSNKIRVKGRLKGSIAERKDLRCQEHTFSTKLLCSRWDLDLPHSAEHLLHGVAERGELGEVGEVRKDRSSAEEKNQRG